MANAAPRARRGVVAPLALAAVQRGGALPELDDEAAARAGGDGRDVVVLVAEEADGVARRERVDELRAAAVAAEEGVRHVFFHGESRVRKTTPVRARARVGG